MQIFSIHLLIEIYFLNLWISIKNFETWRSTCLTVGHLFLAILSWILWPNFKLNLSILQIIFLISLNIKKRNTINFFSFNFWRIFRWFIWLFKLFKFFLFQMVADSFYFTLLFVFLTESPCFFICLKSIRFGFILKLIACLDYKFLFD